MPEEDGVIHGDGQLQHRRQRLGDIGDLAEEYVGTHVVENGDADARQKHQRHQPGVGQQLHGYQRAQHGDAHVDGLLPFAQVFQIRHQCGDTGDKALLAAELADLGDGLDGLIRRGRGVKEHGDHGGVAVHEHVAQLVGQQLLGDAQIRDAVVPQGAVHVGNLLDSLAQVGDVLVLHALRHDEAESAFSEFVHQDVLPFHGLDILRQIGEHIVVDACGLHPQPGGDYQRQRQNQNRQPQLDDCFPEFVHAIASSQINDHRSLKHMLL